MRLTVRWPLAAAPPSQRPGTPTAAPGMAWPGTLVARALATGQQWWHRRAARLTAVAAVTAAAVLSGLQHHPTISARAAVVAAVAATAPLAALRRSPAAALAIMLAAQAGILLSGRLSWTPVLVLVWLLTLALCPLLLPRPAAIGALAAMEAVIVVAVFLPGTRNPVPWDATAAEAAIAIVAWGAGRTSVPAGGPGPSRRPRLPGCARCATGMRPAGSAWNWPANCMTWSRITCH